MVSFTEQSLNIGMVVLTAQNALKPKEREPEIELSADIPVAFWSRVQVFPPLFLSLSLYRFLSLF